MVFSVYTKRRILFFYSQGLLSTAIQKELQKEDIRASVVGIWKFIQRYEQFGSIERRPGSGRTSIVSPGVEATIEAQMENDDETTASQLQTLLLTRKGCSLSLSTIKRSRSRMGLTFRGSAYCQLIRENNKEKRLVWAQENLTAALTDGFTDVIWTDETSVQLESHRRHCFRKTGCQPRPKPRYLNMYIILLHDIITFSCRAKHPTKVHVRAGISWVGATQIVIFDGLMDAEGYSNILRAGLLPFIREKLPTHKLMQDNDPKHNQDLFVGSWKTKG